MPGREQLVIPTISSQDNSFCSRSIMHGASVCRTVLHDSISTRVLDPSGTDVGMKAAACLEGTTFQLIQLPGRKVRPCLHFSNQREESLSSADRVSESWQGAVSHSTISCGGTGGCGVLSTCPTEFHHSAVCRRFPVHYFPNRPSVGRGISKVASVLV